MVLEVLLLYDTDDTFLYQINYYIEKLARIFQIGRYDFLRHNNETPGAIYYHSIKFLYRVRNHVKSATNQSSLIII